MLQRQPQHQFSGDLLFGLHTNLDREEHTAAKLERNAPKLLKQAIQADGK